MGMQPFDFRECTLFEIADFIIANADMKRLEYEAEKKKMYNLAMLFGRVHAINMSNMMGKRSRKYPTFDELFPSAESENDEDKLKLGIVTKNNKKDFYRQQKLAYEKMGVKFE